MRMRFKPEEKAAFTPGARVEWRTGRYWYPGVVVEGPQLDPGQAIWHVVVRNEASTPTVSPGHIVHAIPTAIRVPEGNS